MHELLDCAAAWDGLPPEVQRRVGIAAIVVGLAEAGIQQRGYTTAFDAASFEGVRAIHDDVQDHVLEALAHPDIPRPDLSCIGVVACQMCGCTEDNACPEGCDWAEPGLCTSCAPSDRAART